MNRALHFYKQNGLNKTILNIGLRLSWGYLKYLVSRNINSITSFEPYIVKDILGSKMYLRKSTFGLSFELIVDGIRENYITESWQKEINSGDIIVDIGANIGYYALLEAKLTGEKGKVYAIEPIPDNITLLKKSIDINNYKNIDIYQLAIGNSNGNAPIYVGKARNLSSMRMVDSYAEQGGYIDKIDVKLITLDEFLKDKPSPNVVRMDTEGYEYEIIRGMSQTLAKRLPMKMFIEFHFDIIGKEKSLELLTILQTNGFEISDATIEEWIVGSHQHKFIAHIVSYLAKKSGAPPYGHKSLTISDIISNDMILEGKWGKLEICFKR